MLPLSTVMDILPKRNRQVASGKQTKLETVMNILFPLQTVMDILSKRNRQVASGKQTKLQTVMNILFGRLSDRARRTCQLKS